MLNAKVYIDSPSGSGPQYNLTLYMANPGQARYVIVNDILTDSLGRQYRVVSWATYPSDFSEGGVMTVEDIDLVGMPTVDADYNSSIDTPGLIDTSPFIKTLGTIDTASLHSGQNYEYTITASWVSFGEAAKAQVGDFISDSTGHVYEITQLTSWSNPVRVKELDTERYGLAPLTGSASLFRATENLKLYTGQEVSPAQLLAVQTRDSFYLDLNTGGGPAESEWTSYVFSYEDLSDLSDTASINLSHLPANTVLEQVLIKLSQSFSGTALETYTVEVGIAGETDRFASAFDCMQATDEDSGQISSVFAVQSFDNPKELLVTAKCTGGILADAEAGNIVIALKMSPVTGLEE